MTREEGALLLKAARSAIEAHLRDQVPSLPETENPALLEKRGAFVTLHDVGGDLRGCIGRVASTEALIQTVSQMAVEAAFHDPRFLPLKKEELESVSLEISVLSQVRRMNDLHDIEVGRDGFLIQKGFASGLLLPQVAAENGWNRETFLAHACMKAGLPPAAWKEEDAEIYTFSAEIFSEGTHA